jgi:hypothetical protein
MRHNVREIARKIKSFIAVNYALDFRALSIMRIGTGITILIDLIIRLPDLDAHYSDEGIWPLRMVKHLGWQPGFWSIHTLSGTHAFVLAVFLVHMALALLLVAGFRTKIVTPLLWLLAISLNNRNIYVTQGGDDLLRMILFWGMFLPWNACYSWDSRTTGPPAQHPLANMGYLLLLASVYLFSVLHRTSNEWWREGTAAYYSLSLGQFRLWPVGEFIYRMPQLLKQVTWLVTGIECIVPLLLLWPSAMGRTRMAAFALLFMLHLGIVSTHYVGIFFIIGIVSATGLLPPSFFNRLHMRWIPADSAAIPSNPLASAALVAVILLDLAVNMGTVSYFPYRLNPALAWPVNVLRLDQRWAMFSPGITKKDGWLVAEAADNAGHFRDIQFNDTVIHFRRPRRIVEMYSSDRWRKLAENMQDDHYSFLRPLYGNYLLRQWNREHPEMKMNILNLYFMEVTILPGYAATPPKKILYCVCYAP